jgi:5-methylcytosine-specific restriction endonuclease McrBC GTP-binding regulatory subunit McrB
MFVRIKSRNIVVIFFIIIIELYTHVESNIITLNTFSNRLKMPNNKYRITRIISKIFQAFGWTGLVIGIVALPLTTTNIMFSNTGISVLILSVITITTSQILLATIDISINNTKILEKLSIKITK